MKIGLIIHSVTGNTLKVANVLKEKLESAGHEAVIDEIKTAKKVEFGDKDVQFTHMPDLKGYDLLVFGSHTEAFQLEQAMKIYFSKIEKLQCKAICMATHQFPLKWLGGTGTVKKMKTLCEIKGLDVIGTAIVDWSPEDKRNQKIENAVNYITGLVG